MKSKHILIISATLTFAAALSIMPASAMAKDETPVKSEQTPLDFLGSPAPGGSAERTIIINAETKFVNVDGGSTVRFIVGDHSFTWSFQTGGSHISPFNLTRLAPPGTLDHKVIVYVSDDPLYMN